MCFNGRNILNGFPEELTRVVTFLNEKAEQDEFVFSIDPVYWEDHDDIIDSLGMSHLGNGYYFAVSLAYIANQCNGNLIFPEKANIWRWAWSLNILAAFAGWNPSLFKKVIDSFNGQKEDIDALMNTAAQTYARANFDNGLVLLNSLPTKRMNILAGLMENDYTRYSMLFLPKDNPEEFANSFLQAYLLEKDKVNDTFDVALSFDSFNSSLAMAFFIKAHAHLTDDRKIECEARISEMLGNGCTIDYVGPITNWVFRQNKCMPFMEECVLSLVKGLGKENSASLIAVDNALTLHHDEKEFLSKLILCVAEYLEPTDVLKLEKCLHCLRENKEEFLNMVLSFILHPKGLYRLTGRKLWDNNHLETFDFKASELDETLQIVFIYSMLQDFGNPERRLPKILPLLTDGSEKVRSVLMQFIHPYVDEYMGHVTNALNELNIDCEEANAIRKYVDERASVIRTRREMKELNPLYTDEKVFREAIRQQNKHLHNQIKEAEATHRATWQDLCATVMLARGGGWRDEKGNTQHLPLNTFSVPSRIMAESMSPKEQDEWLNQLLKDWDDTTGNN